MVSWIYAAIMIFGVGVRDVAAEPVKYTFFCDIVYVAADDLCVCTKMYRRKILRLYATIITIQNQTFVARGVAASCCDSVAYDVGKFIISECRV